MINELLEFFFDKDNVIQAQKCLVVEVTIVNRWAFLSGLLTDFSSMQFFYKYVAELVYFK